MISKNIKKSLNTNNHSGIVLFITLLVLVMLSIIAYTLTARVSAQRHRCQYIIDYQTARYACDAGTKYALATMYKINPQLIKRENKPDFSDIFAMTEEEYKQLLDELASQRIIEKNQNAKKPTDDLSNQLSMPNATQFSMPDANRLFDILDSNGVENPAELAKDAKPKKVSIPGPYGPPWPLVTKPLEFEIGSAKIRIEIEDENAKYPLGWTLLDSQEIEREIEAGFKTFCEWMEINDEEFSKLKSELDEIAEIKPFRLKFPTLKKKEKVTVTRTITRGKRTIEVPKTEIKEIVIPASVHTKAFAEIFHSSMVDADILARPTILGENRKESALKYIGLWGSSTVNINTAPRQVLEAAFTFGGDAAEIAEEIIRLRKIEPFKDIDDLRSNLLEYSDSINKCAKYISTKSNFFTIRITATSGTAKTSTVIAVKKNGSNVEKVAVMSG